MCPLQNINDIEPLSLTLHGVNACFIHHPSNGKNYSIGHKFETGHPQKRVALENILLHLSANFGFNIQNNHCYRKLFQHLANQHLMA